MFNHWFEISLTFPLLLPSLKEIWWLAGRGKQITSDNLVAENLSIKVNEKNPGAELVEALTGDSGCLQAGALPSSGLATAEGDKNAWESVMKGSCEKAKPAKRKREEKTEAEEVKPKTMREPGPKFLKHIIFSLCTFSFGATIALCFVCQLAHN